MGLTQYFRKDNPFDYIVLAFIMKMLAVFFGFYFPKEYASSFFGIISWILIFKGVSKIPERLHFPFSRGYKMLLSFYFLQLIVIIFRGYIIDYPYPWFTTISIINHHLFEPTYVLCYFMPLFAMIPIRYFNFRLTLKYSTLFVFITLLLTAIYWRQIITASFYESLQMGIDSTELIKANNVAFYKYYAFVPLFYYFLPRKKWLINLIGLASVVLLMLIGARRGATMLMTLLLLGSLYFYSLSKKGFTKVLLQVFLVLFLAFAAYLLFTSSLTNYILERGFEDSRSGVDEALLEQMTPLELVFGKGLNGRYYYPINDVMDFLNGWRYGTETGFLNLVLKGGFLFAITYVLMLAIPAFKGLFRSKNLFCKAGGFYISYSLFALWPFGQLSFDLSFLFIWMMVVCCMNKGIRKMTDNEIRQKFFYNLK